MTITLAFDVYGTLLNTHGVVSTLEKYIGNKALDFSKTWRDKQLEYSFRRGLMQNYESFAVCTRDALDFTSSYLKVNLGPEVKQELLEAYKILPAFDDVAIGLAQANKSGFRMFAFSNGSAETVEALLDHAGIRSYFLGVVSVDDVKSFKPNPGVYSHFLRKTGSVGSDTWLISSNSFDVIGAISFGMRSIWVKRSQDAIFDPWGMEPSLTVVNLLNLAEQINQF
jgi:2-haloacid dehalogenase